MVSELTKDNATVIAFCGPSGIGKGFIKEQLLQTYSFIEELVWFTTRPLRPNEEQGNRISVPLYKFNQLDEDGELILVQDLFGHRYGLKRDDLLPNLRIRITELHPDNLKKALKINPAIIAIGFITNEHSLLQKRLSAVRNTESPAEIDQRIIGAKIEIETILKQKSLFTSVIEVTRYSETSIFDQVLAILTPYLTKEEI